MLELQAFLVGLIRGRHVIKPLRRRRRSCAVAVLAFLSCVCPSRHAIAANIYWNGGTNSYWSLVDNWNRVGGGIGFHRVPGDSDNAILNTDFFPLTNDVLLGTDTAPVDGVTVYDGIQLSTNGYRLTVDYGGLGFTRVHGSDSSLTVDTHAMDPTSLAFDTDNLSVRAESELQINGAHAWVDHHTIVDGGGSIFLSGSQASLTTEDLRIANDTTVGGSGLVDVTSQASLTVTGTGSHEIGLNGDARLRIASGATASIAGTTNVGTTLLGATHHGQLWVLDGGALSIGNTYVGGGHGSNEGGTIILDGANATVTQTGGSILSLGGSAGRSAAVLSINPGGIFTTGTGLLTIHDTGSLSMSANATGIGRLNANGDILVDGGFLFVGADDTLTLAAGRTLTTRNGGRVSIEGTVHSIDDDTTFDIQSGSTLAVHADLLRVGWGSPGTLNVDGGDVNIEGDLWVAGGRVVRESGVLWPKGDVLVSHEGVLDLGGPSVSYFSGNRDWEVSAGGHLRVGNVQFSAGGSLLVSGNVDGDDFLIWQSQFGTASGGATGTTVPEPTTCLLLLLGICLAIVPRRTTGSWPTADP